jgi:hypothetical protein
MDQLNIWLKPFVWPWVATILDWIAVLPDWMKDSKAIEIVLLLIIGTQLGRVVRQLRRQRAGLDDVIERLGERLSAFRKMLQAVRDETETANEPETPSPADAGPEYWEKVRSLWAITRNRIESRIDQISDGRVRRKYANMDRYVYRDIIFALNADNALTNTVAANLFHMSGIFMKLRRNPKSATKQDAERFEALYKAVSSSLPEEGAQEPLSAKDELVSQSEPTMPELSLDFPVVSGQIASQHSSGQRTNGPIH